MIHDLTKTRVEIVKPSLSRELFLAEIADNTEIIGFKGWCKITANQRDNKVSAGWLHAMTPKNDGTEDERTKTFTEYVGENMVFKSTIDGHYMIPLGYRNQNGWRDLNNYPVTNAELRLWIEKFGIENIFTKSEGESLIYKEPIEDF